MRANAPTHTASDATMIPNVRSRSACRRLLPCPNFVLNRKGHTPSRRRPWSFAHPDGRTPDDETVVKSGIRTHRARATAQRTRSRYLAYHAHWWSTKPTPRRTYVFLTRYEWVKAHMP